VNELRTPGRVVTVPCQFGPGHYWFNPALVEQWGRTWFIPRMGRLPAMLGMCEIDERLHAGPVMHLWGCSDSNVIAEDPRAIAVGDSIRVWYVGIHADRNPSCSMFSATIDANGTATGRRVLRHEATDTISAIKLATAKVVQQKNWVPFIVDGRQLCVYSHQPFTILEDIGNKMSSVHTGKMVAWDYGEIRGGAPPVRHDGLWWHWFHSSRVESDGKFDVLVYYVGVYAFDDSFQIQKITPEPVMAGSAFCYSQPWDMNGRVSAVFPCGALIRGGNWLVSYGYLDTEARIAEIPLEAVEERMISYDR
jgi:predicted GH43/DUF377 family glycosyl hydrolase